MSEVNGEAYEEDPNQKRRKKNRLSSLDKFWVAVAIVSLSIDTYAFIVCLQRRFRGVYFFGGQTQFLSTWNFLIRILGLAMFVFATIAYEPHPERFILRQHERRDWVYRNTASLLGLSITLSPVVAVCHGIFMRAGEDLVHSESIAADWWICLAMPLLGWIFLVFCRPRHWMYGPARYVARSGRRLGLAVGASGVHRLLLAFCAWAVVCRLLGGRWGYRFMRDLEQGLSPLRYVGTLLALSGFLQVVAWVSWWMAYCISPPIDAV